MSQIDDFLGGKPAQPAQKSQIDTFLDAAPPPSRGFKGWVGDALGVATRGAIAVPEAVVGALDIPTRGAVGKFLENEDGMVGFRPKQGKEAASELFDSDATKAQNSQFQEADGVVGKAKVALSNPSMIGRAVGESIPSMLTGGVAARGVQAATKIGPAIAGAIGEGIVGAGSQAEQIRQETPDGLLTPTQSALAGATGLATTAFGAAGGRVAQRLGIGDAETLLAQGAKGVASKNADDAARAATNPLLAQAPKSVPRSVIEGAISEGLLEELPQSLAEQLFQNLALDKPWDTDLDGAAVMGVLSGGAMGAGAAGYSAATRPRAAAAPGQEAAAPGVDAAPAAPGLELAPMGGDLPAQGADVRDTPLAEQSAMDSVRTTFDPRAGTQPAPGLLPQADPNGIPYAVEDPGPDFGHFPPVAEGTLPPDQSAALRAGATGQLADLQLQEQGEQVVPQTAPPDGAAALAQQTAAEQARRDAALAESRAVESPDDEILQSTGAAPRAVRPSEAMGLDPAAGSMSAAAALAVDSGATQQMAATEAAAQAAQQRETAATQAQQAQAKEQAAAEKATAAREQAAEKAARAGQARLDMATGDLLEPASLSNLTGEQLAETYRAARKPATKRLLEKELTKRAREAEAPAQVAAPAPAAAPAAAPAPVPAAEANLSARERAGLASTIAGRELADQTLSPELAGLQDQLAQVQQRAADNGSWNVPLMAQRRRIEDAIAKLQPATTEGEASGPETAQAQQDRAQPPQGPAAPAVAPAAPDAQGSGGPQSAGPAGVADGGTTTANAGAQAAPAPGAPAQAPSSEVEALRQQLRDVEAKILQAAPAAVGQGGGDIEAAMKSRKVPVPLKAQRKMLQEQVRQAGTAVAQGKTEAVAPAAPRLDHGELNIPGRTSTINAELDRFKADQARERKETARERSVVFKKRQDEARAALEEVGAQMVQSFKKLDPKAAKQELDSMATWEPEKLLALVERWKGEQGKAESAAPPAADAQAVSARKPRGILAKKAAAEEQARSDYFTPGNIVKSYGGHDRVVSYQAPDETGRWSVTVRQVQAQSGKWVDVPNQRDRVHATQPDAKELKAGPVARAAVQPDAAPDAQQAAAPAAAPQTLLERHNAVERGISEGTLQLEQYQQTFAALVQDEAATKAEISKLTKDDLLRSGGPNFAYRYKNDKKEVIVNAGYNAMLDTYALGRKYGSNSFVMSAGGLRAHQEAQDKALRELVANTTQEDLAARAAEIKAARDEFKARREAAASALENPKTLQDFRGFMRHWIEAGEASDVAFLRLTPEQRQAFDALEAEGTRDAREKAKADARKASVRSAGETTAGEIVATKHTKHGHDLFVVQLADRVSREDYETLNNSARRLGGSYSSYRGNGATPGFQFRARESAEAFQQLVAGDTTAAQAVAQARRDAFEDDKSQTAVERLRTMADAIDAGADAQLSADRKTNTARRARMASAAEEAARGGKAFAGTMRNLADAIEAGKAPFLDGVRTKTQLSQLQQAIGAAKAKQLHAKYGSWAAAEEHKHDPADAQTVDFAEFPRFGMFRSDLAGLARQLLEIDGGKKLGAALERVADDVTEAYTEWAKANLLQVSQFGRAGAMADFANKADAERAIKRAGLVGKAVVLAVKRGQNRVVLSPGEAMQRGLWQGDGDKRINLSMDFVQDLVKLGKRRGSSALTIPWQLESTLEKRQRLQRMGIQTPAEYRSALRELVSLRENSTAPDRIKELERSMVGRQNDGLDFFPTATAVTENAVDAADIQDGMDVLEPSAGMGHIADFIREQTGVEPDVVELSGKRRELLEAKGYTLVGSDFLEVAGKQYDRIVMNPPFSDGRDIQHVRHAFSLLKPGGRVVAIMSESAFFQSNKRAEAFREWLDTLGATNEKLPDGSFMDASLPVNTGVAARMVVIDKPEGTVEQPPRDETSTTSGDGEPAFRRDAEPAPFDTAGFLATMARSPFSQAARAQAVQSVQATVDAARAAWGPNAPQVVVAFDMQDPAVPEAARRADLRQRSGGARGAPEGFYYRGKAYMMASRLGTPNDAARVLFHEVLGHHGLRGKFGRELDQVLNQIATMRKKEVAAKMREYGLRGVDSLSVREAAEEVLAEMAEKTPQLHFVRRAVSAIRNWLRANVPGFQSLRLTDNDIIQAYILPARGWVERGGAQAGEGAEPTFSRSGPATMPDAIIGGPLGTATSHPDYAAAKAGDIEAAVRLAQSLVTPELGAKVKAAIGDARPRVVPVVAEESAGRNKIPLTAAEVLARELGLDVETGIVQANRAHRTGLDGLDRIFAPVDFAGSVAPGQYLLLDDTLTQGGTFAALADHIRGGGGEVAGVIALTGKQYSAKIQASPETLTSLRQKHGDLEDQFRAATGYGFDALTESEARYLARYEPAQRLRDRIVEAGRSSGERADQSDPGQDDGADGGLSFSRSKLSEITDSALDQLQQTMSHAGKVSLWDKTVGTMRHLGERAPAFKPVYEAAQRFIDDVSMLGNDAADRAPRLLPRVETLADLKKKPITAADNKAIARPLFEGTLLWGRDVDGKAVSVDDLTKKYGDLPAAEKAQLLLRAGRIEPKVLQMWQGLPMAQFEAAMATRFEGQMLRPGVAWKAQELADLFGLTPQQVSLYQEARSAIDRSIDITARADMLRAVGSEYASMRELVLAQDSLEDAMKVLTDTLQADARENPDRAERLLGLNNAVVKSAERAQELQAAGYAPLSRFGRYTVDVVSPDGTREYFGMFETMREANQMRMRMAGTFPGATVISGTMSQEAFKLFQGITPESLEQFGGMLGLSSTGDEAKDKAFQAYLQLAKNNHSALKRLIHRKGISGYSEDVGRVLASFVYSNARLAAGGLNAGTLETAIEGIPKEQGELRDVAMGLRSYIQDPQEEGQAVRGMLFAQYLGGSVASALVNMTQPFQITMPWLSQYGGMRKAGAHLAAAVRDMARGGRGYEPDLVKALQAAEDDGVVSPQEIHQLMAQARGAGSLRTGDGTRAGDARAAAANNWERVKVAWGQPFALAEQFNRRSTFIAAYRLAKDQGMDAPAEFARRAVLETQFVYSKANKPKWARGAIGGTLFTFKTYSVSYLELMQRMWTQGGPEGRRAVGWALAMLMLMGGAGGLPFVEDLEDLIDGAGQLMGYNLSSKQWRKQAMRDAVGKELADFLENGVSGLPGAPIDISGRLGMGNLLPGTGLLLSKQNRERDLLEVAGPAGDLVARGFTGARKALTGDLAGAALEVSPAAVRNAVKGADMAASGIYKDTKGYKVIDTTLDEALAKAIGFQPRSVAEVQESNSAMQRAKSFYVQTSSEIKAQWADALFRKDEADLQRVRERLAAWNRDNPDQPITVKMPDIWKRVREMGKDRTERIADTAPKALRQQMREMAREG